MDTTKIRFAFAVNRINNFEAKHFGDADKYLIYEFSGNEFVFVREQINEFKTADENAAHGSKEKGTLIIELLKESGVNVLVSRQFGRNIKMVNSHFIPVIIHNTEPVNVLSILSLNMRWLVDELELNPERYKLFNINKGILKSSISEAVN
jgi:predicted Fe-Mo cluster-binding NifX family protein